MHVKSHRTEILTVNQAGGEPSPVVCVVSLQRFGFGFTWPVPGTVFPPETFSCEHCTHGVVL